MGTILITGVIILLIGAILLTIGEAGIIIRIGEEAAIRILVRITGIRLEKAS
jgi:hypothetical protein